MQMKYAEIFNKDRIKKLIQNSSNFYEFSIMITMFILILIVLKILI